VGLPEAQEGGEDMQQAAGDFAGERFPLT